jgi:RNA polymerase sigma factor (sigma-70 family)
MVTRMNGVVQCLRRAVLQQDSAGLTDGDLLACFIERRDEAAAAALVRRHGPMVWGVCRRTLCNPHDAEDAFQATFLVLVRKATSIAPREMVGNWLYGVARQTALKAKAIRARRQTRERQLMDLPESRVSQDEHWHDLQPVLDQELSRLPDKYRVAIVLCYLEGKTRKEAARQLGVPDGTLAARLARARAMLAKRLARRGLTVTCGALAVALSRSAAARAPISVVSSTIKVARLIAAGQAAAGKIPRTVASLTEGMLKTMLLAKLKTATAAVLLTVIILVAGVRSYWSMNPVHAAPVFRPGNSHSAEVVRNEAEQRDETRKVADPATDRPQRRVLRWRLSFDTKDGGDYAKQIEALGAILAVPTGNSKQYRVIRDLSKRPVTSVVEDVGNVDRIFWVENDEESIRSLAKELGLAPVPQRIFIFLPKFVEDELLRKELAYARRQESDIAETTFRFFRTAKGFDLKVVCQSVK